LLPVSSNLDRLACYAESRIKAAAAAAAKAFAGKTKTVFFENTGDGAHFPGDIHARTLLAGETSLFN